MSQLQPFNHSYLHISNIHLYMKRTNDSVLKKKKTHINTFIYMFRMKKKTTTNNN